MFCVPGADFDSKKRIQNNSLQELMLLGVIPPSDFNSPEKLLPNLFGFLLFVFWHWGSYPSVFLPLSPG